jgi:allantoate deiminase
MVGKAGHAGGTRFEARRDALVGAAEVVVAVERISKELGVIGTVGRIEAEPGGVNVIPGRVVFSLDLRAEFDDDRDDALRQIFDAAGGIAARRGLEFSSHELYRADATVCDLDLRDAIAAGIRATGDAEPLAFWSRAGHDGMAVSAVTPVAMLFLRCRHGVSHHPDEAVRASDVDAAIDAMEAAVLELARVRA